VIVNAVQAHPFQTPDPLPCFSALMFNDQRCGALRAPIPWPPQSAPPHTDSAPLTVPSLTVCPPSQSMPSGREAISRVPLALLRFGVLPSPAPSSVQGPVPTLIDSNGIRTRRPGPHPQRNRYRLLPPPSIPPTASSSPPPLTLQIPLQAHCRWNPLSSPPSPPSAWHPTLR